MEKPVAEMEELPKAIVRRIVKDKLSQCSPDYDIHVHKETSIAFSESARIFIHYLSATANDICKETRRQTINANDVFKALEEMEFPEFIQPLKASLEEFKQKNDGKKAGSSKASKAKEVQKKRKLEELSNGNRGESKENEENEDNNNIDNAV